MQEIRAQLGTEANVGSYMSTWYGRSSISFCISGFRNLGKFEPGNIFVSEVAKISPGSNFPKMLEAGHIARLEFPQNPQKSVLQTLDKLNPGGVFASEVAHLK